MDDEDWTPPRGHNNPPLDLATILAPHALTDLLATTFKPHSDRCTELLAADARFMALTKDGIRDDETAGKATDFVRQLKAASEATDTTRVAVKAPVLAAQRQIDGVSKLITVPLDAAATVGTGRISAYLRQKEAETRARALEEARLREVEAQRLIREAEAAAKRTPATPGDAEAQDAAEIVATEKAVAAIDAAQQAATAAQANAADLSRTRTVLGGVASLRQNWTYELTDKLALLRAIIAGECSADYVVVADPLLKALAKSQKDRAKVAGVRFFNDVGVTIR